MNAAWALVEWIDKNNGFTSYEVIFSDTFSQNDFQPGKQVVISLLNRDPRRAKIIRISDNKRKLKEHKAFLERQDLQVNNVTQPCMRTTEQMMRTIKNVKSEPQETTPLNTQEKIAELIYQNYQNSRDPGNILVMQNLKQEPHSSASDRIKLLEDSSIGMVRLEQCKPEDVKLYFDEGTQTDAELPLNLTELNELELELKQLYGQYQSFLAKINISEANGNLTMLAGQNRKAPRIKSNESVVAGHGKYAVPEYTFCGKVGSAKSVKIENGMSEWSTNPVKMETVQKSPKSNRVRKMSAQTTTLDETMVTGKMRVRLPAELLNAIDWSSYTTATKQLLQSIFPWKVLATHSITGKLCPVHPNEPAQEVLDPSRVRYIIKIVASRCGVPPSFVRNRIMYICAEEANFYRDHPWL